MMKTRLFHAFACILLTFAISSCNRIEEDCSFTYLRTAEEYVNDTSWDCSIQWVGKGYLKQKNQCNILNGTTYKEVGGSFNNNNLYIGREVHFLFSDGSYFDINQVNDSFWSQLPNTEYDHVRDESGSDRHIRRCFLSDIYEMAVKP